MQDKIEDVTDAMKAAADTADRTSEQIKTLFQAKRTPTRTERRAQDRAFMANQRHEHKVAVARNVANDRGTLPDARELFKIHQARKAITARLNAAQDRAATIEEMVANLPEEARGAVREALAAIPEMPEDPEQ